MRWICEELTQKLKQKHSHTYSLSIFGYVSHNFHALRLEMQILHKNLPGKLHHHPMCMCTRPIAFLSNASHHHLTSKPSPIPKSSSPKRTVLCSYSATKTTQTAMYADMIHSCTGLPPLPQTTLLRIPGTLLVRTECSVCLRLHHKQVQQTPVILGGQHLIRLRLRVDKKRVRSTRRQRG